MNLPPQGYEYVVINEEGEDVVEDTNIWFEIDTELEDDIADKKAEVDVSSRYLNNKSCHMEWNYSKGTRMLSLMQRQNIF